MSTCDFDSLMYYNITLQVLQCSCIQKAEDQNHEKQKYTYPKNSKYMEQPLYEKSLFSRIQEFFDTPAHKEIANSEHPVQSKDVFVHSCLVVKNYGVKIESDNIPRISYIFSLLLSVTLLITILVVVVQYVKKQRALNKQSGDTTKLLSSADQIKSDKLSVEIVPSVTSTMLLPDKQNEAVSCKQPVNNKENVLSNIQLVYQSYISTDTQCKHNVAEVLNGTVDKLFAKLDKVLLKSPSTGPSQTALATPRLNRRPLHRRQRMGSSPSLPVFDNPPESLPTTTSPNNHGTKDWILFKKFCRKMSWKEPVCPNVMESNLSTSNQQLLRYFQRVCPVSREIWECATLITNYALLLFETELKQMRSLKGYRFIDMVASGSAIQGTKVGMANQFDVLMILQPPVLPHSVVNIDNQGKIPPGSVLINTQTDKPEGLLKQGTLCKFDFPESSSPYLLSAKDLFYAAEELVNTSLQNLYTKTRLEMDRLPFKMSRTSSAKLSVSLDTKNIVGLGLTDIKITIYPVMFLPVDGWFQNVPIYATPPQFSEDNDLGTSIKKSAVPYDFLWALNFVEFYSAYLQSVEMKMKYAGINSCHKILLMILKSLFTGCNRNNLLDRGELLTTHISHTINFLLLESSPQQWTYDHLADRFSDVVHFLRDAFQNERLPNFYLNNPHLTTKVPFVVGNKLFKQTRQQNILSDVPNKEKCLEYMDKCLRESGLKSCVKEGYSPEMWEYEFFVY